MPSISQLVAEKAVDTINVRGLQITVTYRPNKITMRYMTELARRGQADDVEAIADMVPELLEAWDLEGPLEDSDGNELVGAGKVIPVEREMVVNLPAMFVVELSQKLQELVASGPNPTKATPRSRKR